MLASAQYPIGVRSTNGHSFGQTLTNATIAQVTTQLNSGSIQGGTFVSRNVDLGTATGWAAGRSTDSGVYTYGATASAVDHYMSAKNGVEWGGNANAAAFLQWDKVTDRTMKITTHKLTEVSGFSEINQGAPASFSAFFNSGNVAGAAGLPSHGPEIQQAQRFPTIGIYMGNTLAGIYQTNFQYVTNMAYFFSTSGLAAAWSPFGINPAGFGDNGWSDTNRDAGGNLAWHQNTNVWGTAGPGGVSNKLFVAHDLVRFKFEPHIYHLPDPVNQTNADTQILVDRDGSSIYGYPSSNSFINEYVSPAITSDTYRRDIKWFYTNGCAGLFSANTINAYNGVTIFGLSGYDLYRTRTLGNAILYPDGTSTRSGTPVSELPYSVGQMTLGMHVNNSHYAVAIEANSVVIDNFTPYTASITPNGVSKAAAYARTYAAFTTNWPPGSAIPVFSTQLASLSWAKADFTNYYSIAAVFHAKIYMDWDRAAQTWNNEQNDIAKHIPMLEILADRERHWPKQIMNINSYTNAAFACRLFDGDYALCVWNETGASSNYTLTLPNAEIPTNNAWTAIDVWTGANLGSATNTLVLTVASGSARLVRLCRTPYIDPTDFVMNQYYTNGTKTAQVSACIGLESTSGLAAVGLWLDNDASGGFEQTGIRTALLPNIDSPFHTNQLSAWIPPGGRFVFTNLSALAAASAAISPGSSQWVKLP